MCGAAEGKIAVLSEQSGEGAWSFGQALFDGRQDGFGSSLRQRRQVSVEGCPDLPSCITGQRLPQYQFRYVRRICNVLGTLALVAHQCERTGDSRAQRFAVRNHLAVDVGQIPFANGHFEFGGFSPQNCDCPILKPFDFSRCQAWREEVPGFFVRKEAPPAADFCQRAVFGLRQRRCFTGYLLIRSSR